MENTRKPAQVNTRKDDQVILAAQKRLLKLRSAAGIPIDIGTAKRTEELERRVRKAASRRRRPGRERVA